MSAEANKPVVRPPQWLVNLVTLLLPRVVREDYRLDFDRPYFYASEMVREVPSTIFFAYKNQTLATWHLSIRLAEATVVVFCFSASAAPISVVAVTLSVLMILTARDAYLYQKAGFLEANCIAPTGYSTSRYYLDSCMDALLTAVLLLGSQAVLQWFAPSLAVEPSYLSKAGFLCLPLLGGLRMALRPNPARKTPFEGPDLSITAVCRWTWAMNIIWMSVACGIVMTGMKAVPSLPGFLFKLSIFFSTVTFGLMWATPQNALERDNVMRSFKKVELTRALQMLLQPIRKGEPLYRKFVTLQVLAFLEVLAPLAAGLWLWLAGHSEAVNPFRMALNLAGFMALLLTWNFVKTTNIAAVKRLELEIAALKES